MSLYSGLRWEALRREYFERRGEWDRARSAGRQYEQLYEQLRVSGRDAIIKPRGQRAPTAPET